MNKGRPSRFAEGISLLVILALAWTLSLDAMAGASQEKGERASATRSIAGPESASAEESGSAKNKTLITVAIVGGIAAAVLVAVLLLRKKPKPAATTTTTTSAPASTTTISTTTTTAPPDTGSIQADSTPAGARINLDGADTGRTTPALLTGVLVGSRIVKLTLERYQDWQAAVAVSRDQTATVAASLQAGDFRESFDGGTASFWRPAAGSWSAVNGEYVTNAVRPVYFAASEYTLGDYGDFTLEARGQAVRPAGGSGRVFGLIFRGAPNLSRYYLFQVTPGGASPLWDVYEITNGLVTRQYDPWQPTTAVHEGWNTIRVVASGSTFTFYANGQLLGSRTIPEAPARGRVGLGCEVDANGSEVHFDDVSLSGSASSPPGNVFRAYRSLFPRIPPQ